MGSLDAPTKEIYPDPTSHPYYIVAPPYSRFSAGIKVLHLLCHALNRKGQQAFMLIVPDMPKGVAVMHCDLQTPRLTDDIIRCHYNQKRTPIVVYPETIQGNPLNAPVVVRYVLNVPGRLGGDTTYAANEMIFTYSDGLIKDIDASTKMLYLPVTNTRIYNRNGEAKVRSGSCYYARKYKKLFPDNFKPPSTDSIEITWEQSPEELADIYRRVEKFYCYESTSAALDAALCGCPTVSLPNEILKFPIGADSLGMDGHAWGEAPDEIIRAKETIGNVLEQYRKTIVQFWGQLDVFIADTQARAEITSYERLVLMPFGKCNNALRFCLSIVAIFKSFAWRGELNLLVSKAFSNLRTLKLKDIINKIKRGTV